MRRFIERSRGSPARPGCTSAKATESRPTSTGSRVSGARGDNTKKPSRFSPRVSVESATPASPPNPAWALGGERRHSWAIDVATQEIETPEQVAETIRGAMVYVPPARLYPGTNCGMALLSGGGSGKNSGHWRRGAACQERDRQVIHHFASCAYFASLKVDY